MYVRDAEQLPSGAQIHVIKDFPIDAHWVHLRLRAHAPTGGRQREGGARAGGGGEGIGDALATGCMPAGTAVTSECACVRACVRACMCAMWGGV